jgi:F-type H+-transporting ATPase subunit b
MPQLDFAVWAGQVFWLAIHFALFLWLVQRFMLPAIKKGMDARAAQLQADMDLARKLKSEVDYLAADARRSSDETRKKATAAIAQASQEVAGTIVSQRAALQEKLTAELAVADEEISKQRTAALASVDAEAARLGVVIWRNLTQKSIDAAQLQAVLQMRPTNAKKAA